GAGDATAAVALTAAAAHLAACAECRTRLKALDEEQRRFEQEISFDRFAAGVRRASRGAARPAARRRLPRLAFAAAPVLAVAAAVALLVTFVPRGRPGNRMKGGGAAEITVRVAAVNGAQRTAAGDTPEALAAGERVRIGYAPGDHRYLLALSVDDR